MIEVEVLFFARARELAGTARRTVRFADGTTVAAAALRIEEEVPALKGILKNCRLALDEEFTAGSEVLKKGSTLAVIPPVSGG
jgi:molybdopterin converting factor subunit 1